MSRDSDSYGDAKINQQSTVYGRGELRKMSQFLLKLAQG